MTWEQDKESMAREVVTMLYENRMIRTFYRDRPEGWTLISGLYSPIYVQLRPLISHPAVFEKVCRYMAAMIRQELPNVTKVVGLAMAGVPIAAGISMCGLPACFTRKLEGVKSVESFRKAIETYGEHAMLEGELESGDVVALVDDLVTRFDSKVVAMEQVKYEVERRGLSDVDCSTVAVVLDRQQGAEEAARLHGVTLASLIPFKDLGLPLLKDVMNPDEWDVLTRYLDDPDQFQTPEAQAEVKALAIKS
jgi:uridine monophosphate synthetase